MQQRSRRTSLRLLIGLAALGVMTLLASAAQAQTIVRIGRASATVGVSVHVPVRMRAAAGAPTVVASDTEYVEYELPVTVAANADWNLRLLPGAATAGVVELRDEQGNWAPLEDGSATVLSQQPPTNPTQRSLRIRVPATTGTPALTALRLVMEPAAGS